MDKNIDSVIRWTGSMEGTVAGLRFRVKYPMDSTDLYCGSIPFRGQQTTVFKAGQLYETSCSGWKDVSCVSTRENETHWTLPGHARRSVWRVFRILGEKDPENGRVRVSAKKHNNKLWKRMPCAKSTLHDWHTRQKIHCKERQQSEQSCSKQLRTQHTRR